MLPDYPRLKARLQEALHDRMRAVQKQVLGPFGQVDPIIMHEGKGFLIKRSDGSQADASPKSIQSRIEITHDEVEHQRFESVLKKIDQLAIDMGQQQFKLCLKGIEDAVTEVGNTVQMKGRPFDASALIEVYRKVQLDFDEEGNVVPLEFVGNREQLQTALRELRDNPQLQSEMDKLIVLKREEWRARESDRKLVE